MDNFFTAAPTLPKQQPDRLQLPPHEEWAAVRAMERAWCHGRPFVVVQSKTSEHYVEALPFDGFAPAQLPDLQIIFIAWPPGWRYKKSRR